MTGISAGKTWSRIGAEVAPTSSAASGVWQIQEVAENVGAGTWPAPIADYQAIETFQSTSSTPTVSFTMIPASYTMLKIVVYSNRDPADAKVVMSFGTGGGSPDTTDSNYGSQTYLTHGWGSTNASSLTQVTSAWRKYPGVSFPTYSSAGYPSVGMYTFPAYSSTVQDKASWFMGSSRDTQTAGGTASADGGPLKAYYWWNNAGAIDRIDIGSDGPSATDNYDNYTITLFGLAP